VRVETKEIKVPVPTALEAAWTERCIDNTPIAKPAVNDSLLAIIEIYDGALKDCDDRMTKIRDAQPEVEE